MAHNRNQNRILLTLASSAGDAPAVPGAGGPGDRVIANRTVAIPDGYGAQNGGTIGGGSATAVPVVGQMN